MRTLPRINDRVVLPWGRSTVEGTVVRVSKTSDQTYITIDVLLDGTEEPLRVTYPIDLVEPARAA